MPSAKVARTSAAEVPAVAVENHERHETHEKIAGTESASAALSCHSSISWLSTSASSFVKTTLTPIEQIQVGDRVLADSSTGAEDTAFGSETIPVRLAEADAAGSEAGRHNCRGRAAQATHMAE